MNIKLGKELNTFYINSQRHMGLMMTQHMCINANFEDVGLFMNAINHEYIHAILNMAIDRTCKTSMMFDNIDGYGNNYHVSRC